MTLIFDPLLPLPLIGGLVVLALGVAGLSLWRSLRGWALRAGAALVVLAALSGPHLQSEARKPQADILVVLVDDTTSQTLPGRAAQTEAALAHLRAQVALAPGGMQMHIHRFADAENGAGTEGIAALGQALAAEPRARVAGVVMITDGRLHDMAAAAGLPAPLPGPFNVLLTGQPGDWDRHLVIRNAPAFGILGENVSLTLRIDDAGRLPADAGATADLTLTVEGGPPQRLRVPVGQDMEVSVRLPHAGANVIEFSTPPLPGELTAENNAAIVQMTGVRDRLRVLLVSGEPNPGERVWRNLLKSDPSVDLVHFTILRPPEKQDGIPVEELSLIAFPTRELFVEKIKDFDLIIFDRYRMRGILPASYIQNIADYVQGGGTVLVTAGPEFGAVDSLWRSPLSQVLPVEPTSRVLTGGFRPKITEAGARHPVTAGLDRLAPAGGWGPDGWGRWFRMMEVRPIAGQVLMTGADDAPLLVLSRVGQGRVAVLASDQAWLWGRGVEGGGPLQELLKRLAHWMLKEPDLEEEALTATATAGQIQVERRSMSDMAPPAVTVTAPDGGQTTLELTAAGPGLWRGQAPVGAHGVYRLAQADLTAVVAVGVEQAREMAEPVATPELLAPLARAANGGVTRVSDGLPSLRAVRDGRPAVGRGWIGYVPRGAYVTAEVTRVPLLPAWVWLGLAALALLAAWLIEARARADAP